MRTIEIFTGNSELGVDEAIKNALENAGNPLHFEVIEVQGSQNEGARFYQAILKKITR